MAGKVSTILQSEIDVAVSLSRNAAAATALTLESDSVFHKFVKEKAPTCFQVGAFKSKQKQ